MTGSKEYFAKVAQDWDEMRAGHFTEAMRDAAIASAQLEPQAVVADIGTGTGFMIHGLALLVSKVYGFDGSPDMLAVAEGNLSSFENVELRQAGGASLPLRDGALDAVFGNMYLHHTLIRLRRYWNWRGCCALEVVLTDLELMNRPGCGRRWPTAGWALSGTMFGHGSLWLAYQISGWIAQRGGVVPPRPRGMA